MSVTTTASTTSFAGGQDSLTFSFKTLPSHGEYIKLKSVVITSGVETDYTYTSDYTVALETDGVGGVVTIVAATVSTLSRYVVYRETTNTQSSDYEDYNQQPSDTIENDYDRRTLVSQEKDEEVERCLKVPLSGLTFDTTIPYPIASRYLKVNAAGTGFTQDSLETTSTDYNGTIGVGADADKPAAPEANDVYIATDTKRWYTCYTASTWTYSGTFNNIEAATATISSISLATGGTITGTTTSGTLAGNSNTVLPVEKAVKTYVDAVATMQQISGTFTRDMTAATSTQGVTGIGFTPNYVAFAADVTNLTTGSWGVSTSAGTATCLWDRTYDGTDNTWGVSTTSCILLLTDATDEQAGTLQSFDTDGFTISWEKSNTPTTATALIAFTAMKI